jgi:hypothetical protein
MINSLVQRQIFQLSSFIIAICLISSIAIDRQNSVLAQSNVRFFCGATEEINQKPATVIASRGYQRTIVVWEYPMGNMTAQERCDRVTPLFQQAWEQRRFNLRPGTDRTTGQGIICAVRKRDNTCEGKNKLFSLRSGADAKEITSRLLAAIQTGGVSSPVPQSSSSESIDLQELVNFIDK